MDYGRAGYFGVLNGSNELTKYLLVRKYMQKKNNSFISSKTDLNLNVGTYVSKYVVGMIT